MPRFRAEIERNSRLATIYSSADLRGPEKSSRCFAKGRKGFRRSRHPGKQCGGPLRGAGEDFPVAAWDEGIAVNLSAAFHTIRLAMPGHEEARLGRIVNVSSIYGLIGAANRVSYVTSKTALIGMTRAVALETLG